MRQSSRKIPAFTLTEVMITMAISGVVIMLSYATFTMINTYFSKVSSDNSINAEWLSFRYFMSRDVETSDSIFFEQDVLSLYKDSLVVHWYSNGDTLVRTDESSKKFQLPSHSIYVGMDDKLLFVKYIKVSGLLSIADSSSFSFYKNYPPALTLNAN